MPYLGLALRWTIAVPVFVLCCVIGLTVGVTAVNALGGGQPYSNLVGSACAIICGALAGILTAPPQHRRLATHLFVGAVVAYPLYSLVDQYPNQGVAFKQLLSLLGAVAGGAVVYVAIGYAYLNRTTAPAIARPETARAAIRWLVAVLLAPLAFFAIFMLVLLCDRWLGSAGAAQYIWAVILATMIGVTVGVIIVPLRHRSFGFWLFVGAANLASLLGIIILTIRGQVHATDFLDLVGSVCGSALIWHPLRWWRHPPGAGLPGAAS